MRWCPRCRRMVETTETTAEVVRWPGRVPDDVVRTVSDEVCPRDHVLPRARS